MLRLKRAFSRRSEEHLGPVLPLRGAPASLSLLERGAEVVGAGLLERAKDEQRRGEAPSEDTSESVHLRRLSEEESWIKGTAVPGMVR